MASTALAILTLSIRPAGAGAIADCNEPLIFERAAVNVVVQSFETTGDPRHLDLANRIATLIELDTLFSNLPYGSLGVIALTDQWGKGCPDADQLTADLLGAGGDAQIRRGNGLIVFSGRIYLEEDRLFIQSEMRFHRRDRVENFFLPVSRDEGEWVLTAALPMSHVTFPPRLLTVPDIERINLEFAESAMVRSSPNTKASGRPIEIIKGAPFAYTVNPSETSLDGDSRRWIRISPLGPGPAGWVPIGEKHLSEFLHRKLPELELLSGTTGYLQYRIALDRGRPGTAMGISRKDTLDRTRASLREFSGSIDDRTWKRPLALARAMEGLLDIVSAGPSPKLDVVIEAKRRFESGLSLEPYNGKLHNLFAVSLAYICDRNDARGNCFETVWKEFQRALVFEPRNQVILRNVQNYHELLSEERVAKESETWQDRLSKIKHVREAVRKKTPRNP